MPIGRIQTPPRGLLSFFGIVGDQGRTPGALNDEIRGTIELSEFYGSSLFETVTANANAQNIGDEVAIEVPSGQVWRVIASSGTLTLAAGEGVALDLQVSTSPNFLVRVAFAGPQIGGALGAGRYSVIYNPPVPLILPPGGVIKCELADSVLAAPRSLRTTALVQAFDI